MIYYTVGERYLGLRFTLLMLINYYSKPRVIVL